MENINLFLLLLISYILGSTPTSIIAGKIIKGIDIREHGSGNAGGTNVFRILGFKPALIVVIVDVLKGWFPPAILAPLFFDKQIISDLGLVQICCGFAAVLGHIYTVFGNFKGGKGVGTLGGLLIVSSLSVYAGSVLLECCSRDRITSGASCMIAMHDRLDMNRFIVSARLVWSWSAGEVAACKVSSFRSMS